MFISDPQTNRFNKRIDFFGKHWSVWIKATVSSKSNQTKGSNPKVLRLSVSVSLGNVAVNYTKKETKNKSSIELIWNTFYSVKRKHCQALS